MNTNDAENTDTRAKKMNNGESSAVRENKNTSNPVQKVTFDAKSSISKENVSDNETTNDEEDVIGDFHSDRKVIGAEKTNNRKSSRAEMIKKLPNSVNSTKFNVKPGTSKITFLHSLSLYISSALVPVPGTAIKNSGGALLLINLDSLQ
ncbi:uncharacterized protein LOC123260324 [Cotesia glomerata]|uniref:uncharacterized protein LOC123260324 n=1 Tax=Cotesia glomerata TaxID=32391 RepID=UPI001D02EB71|nr:uncharacterized protein LOC123260324 [Cotesia glomerata]